MPNARQDIKYRGFYIGVAASRRLSHVYVSATLRGGPDEIARAFSLPSDENDPALACAVTMGELRQVVDHLLEYRASERTSTLNRTDHAGIAHRLQKR